MHRWRDNLQIVHKSHIQWKRQTLLDLLFPFVVVAIRQHHETNDGWVRSGSALIVPKYITNELRLFSVLRFNNPSCGISTIVCHVFFIVKRQKQTRRRDDTRITYFRFSNVYLRREHTLRLLRRSKHAIHIIFRLPSLCAFLVQTRSFHFDNSRIMYTLYHQ